MLTGPVGGSVKMRNKRHQDNFIEINGFFKDGKELIFIVVIFILAIGKNICQRKLFVWYHIGTTPLHAIYVLVPTTYTACFHVKLNPPDRIGLPLAAFGLIFFAVGTERKTARVPLAAGLLNFFGTTDEIQEESTYE